MSVFTLCKYEYLLYVFEVDGVPIVVIELWFIFILIQLESFYNVGGLGHAFPESPTYGHNTSLCI